MDNLSFKNETNIQNDGTLLNFNNVDKFMSDDTSIENLEKTTLKIDNAVDLEFEEIDENIDNTSDSQTDCTSLLVVKDNKLFVAQKMFKKSIKFSIKSFLISLSLGFLNLFI